ncbi:MAG: N(6)-L-threonylcarbamoyladenine synthase Kae1 [Candidatus Aenigmarchaeota archaeon]|nr:N(6)-L-threonylcarbamoyladenine synthase Kae1 [Candidatus Aenigmarchaeota archaeon]
MICLGIESTAHTFGVGIIENKKILANEKTVYIPKKGFGIIPRDAAQYHSENCLEVFKNALTKADLKMNDVDIIAFSQGPGLPQCLRIGAVFARTLALKYKKPLIPVNHCVAHVEVGKFATQSKDPVVLYLSGGNTQVIAFAGNRYRVFGETQDIPIGNALDMLARSLDLPMPGGPQIDKLALKGKYVELPYVVKGMDLSFTGILTEAVKKYKQGVKPEDIAYSFQETCFAMLTEVTERAVAHTDKEEVLLTGGVAANKRLQEMLRIMSEERGAKFFVVPTEYSGDNGLMIAVTGIVFSKQPIEIEKSKIKQKWRVDEVDIYD